ncbi:MAG: ABC transporter ATP-binding protein [Candidatus Omnitrophica bacterium]|nr:ABC transporter ATP-binding protein [Candidatus Omnitrophota bacterium]MDD5552719.1 ABC transporter ATP-binding protein [Candidatus Omnitrophota bacterium]
MKVIRFKDAWEIYKIKFTLDNKVSWEDFCALKGISFEIGKGEAVGIIGENGSGKTTVLKLIAGMLKPDRGEVTVSGRVSGLLELGAGFQPEFTGKENIYLNAGLFGLSRKETEEKYDEIVDFASLGKFINAPVKCYSQGMFFRLAFSIAIHVDPDILLIDDIFAVGDIYAQRKCFKKILELKEKGATIIFALQDIEMLKRICTRSIFLREGKIIKDGPISSVSNYYMETVGDRRGIAIAQKDALGIIFNNGTLALRWKEETVTSNSGGHSIMSISGREYLSTMADWQVKKSDTDQEIVAIGEWPDVGVRQRWKIAILNEREFLWEIAIQVLGGISIDKADTRIFFTDKYKSWLTLCNENAFPENFIHETEGEAISILDPDNGLVGIKGGENSGIKLPVVVFDRLQDYARTACQLGNTGADISSRFIHYQVFPATSNINFIKEKYTRYFLSKAVIFEPEESDSLADYLKDAKRSISGPPVINNGSLRIFCKNKRVEIYWQDKLITSGPGMNTFFRYEDRDYSAIEGCWEIIKKNNDAVVININWDNDPRFIQTWTLKSQSQELISWDIEMNIDKKVKLRNKQVELTLCTEYEKWLTFDGSGDFDKLEKRGNAVILGKYTNDCIGVAGVYKEDSVVCPGILLRYGDEYPKSSYIFKTMEDAPATTLRFVEIDRKEKFYTPPGNYKYFTGKINIFADKERENEPERLSLDNPRTEKHVTGSSGKIEYDGVTLFFDNGKGKICWKGTELTKGLGLYSSVLFKDVWRDSSQAFWEIEKLGKDKLVATGYWPYIPLTQLWEISILDEAKIYFKVTKEIWEEAALKRMQVNLMLSDKYKEWSVPELACGKFPGKFKEHDGLLWDRLWSGKAGSPIMIKKCKFKGGFLSRGSLPSVILDCAAADSQACYSIIENTDDLFQARVLQYEVDLNQKTDFRNECFEGQIRIIS